MLVRHRPDRDDPTVDLDLVTRPTARGRGLGGELAALALGAGSASADTFALVPDEPATQ